MTGALRKRNRHVRRARACVFYGWSRDAGDASPAPKGAATQRPGVDRHTEFINMKVKQLFTLTALALAGSVVFADQAPTAPLTRAAVVQSVLAARADGTLIPAGEDAEGSWYSQADAARSTLTRAQVQAEVRQARADGTLLPAGEAADESLLAGAADRTAAGTPSTLTRAEVKAEVLQARAEGELIPAGEAENYPPERGADTARSAAAPGPHPTSRGD
jgi:hypothetical protein